MENRYYNFDGHREEMAARRAEEMPLPLVERLRRLAAACIAHADSIEHGPWTDPTFGGPFPGPSDSTLIDADPPLVMVRALLAGSEYELADRNRGEMAERRAEEMPLPLVEQLRMLASACIAHADNIETGTSNGELGDSDPTIAMIRALLVYTEYALVCTKP